jgi:hypothetical protein
MNAFFCLERGSERVLSVGDVEWESGGPDAVWCGVEGGGGFLKEGEEIADPQKKKIAKKLRTPRKKAKNCGISGNCVRPRKRCADSQKNCVRTPKKRMRTSQKNAQNCSGLFQILQQKVLVIFRNLTFCVRQILVEPKNEKVT